MFPAEDADNHNSDGHPLNGNAYSSNGAAEVPMRRYGEEEVDYVVVGVGSAGGVLLQRLARAGFRVVGLEARSFWDVENGWVSQEAQSHGLDWEDLGIPGGQRPSALVDAHCGNDMGEGSAQWAAFAPRLHPSDFYIDSLDGVGVDWPLTYQELKPYYEQLEIEIPVAGPGYFPWGDPHTYAYGPHPTGGAGNALIKGCSKLGIDVSIGGPVAILSGSQEDRQHCVYRAFCLQACKLGAKESTLLTHLPDALKNGAEVRDNCTVSRVQLNSANRVTGVHYFDRDGREHFQRSKAVILSAHAIETPRLLLNSACPGHETGLANSSDTVGRYLMAQAGNVILGRFDEIVRMYKAPPAHCLTEAFYETDPERGFARGFSIQTLGPMPIAFGKQMMTAKGAWGWGLRRVMMDYNHWAAFGLLGEMLPWPENRVQLADETDRFGLPVAKVTFGLRDNDTKLIEFGKKKAMEVMRAAGATEVVEEPGYAHYVGGCRMGSDPHTSVVDKFGRAHDVANLFICDGSILPTQGAANPGLTIQALAARAADYLISQGDRIFCSSRRDMTVPPIRRNLAPPGTYGRGISRFANSLE